MNGTSFLGRFGSDATQTHDNTPNKATVRIHTHMNANVELQNYAGMHSLAGSDINSMHTDTLSLTQQPLVQQHTHNLQFLFIL